MRNKPAVNGGLKPMRSSFAVKTAVRLAVAARLKRLLKKNIMHVILGPSALSGANGATAEHGLRTESTKNLLFVPHPEKKWLPQPAKRTQPSE